MDSSYLPAYETAGWILTASEEYHKGEEVMSAATVRGLISAKLLLSLGEAEFGQNKYNEAIEHLHRSIELDSSLLESRFALARVHFRLGDVRESYRIMRFLDHRADADETMHAFYQHVAVEARERFPELSFEEDQMESIRGVASVNRAQLAFLFRYFLSFLVLEVGTKISFKDMADTHPMVPYCAWAVGTGVLEPLPDEKFHPDFPVKRRNLCHYLYRLLKRNGVEDKSEAVLWTDAVDGDVQAAAMRTVAGLGIIRPVEGNRFGADEPLNGRDAIQAMERIRALLQHRSEGH